VAEEKMSIQKVIVAIHPSIDKAEAMAQDIVIFLRKNEVEASWGGLADPELRANVQDGLCDLLITLGGDGTVLRAGHLSGPGGVPILGINLGRFGFLSEVEENQWQEVLPEILRGEYWLERRMMLYAEQWRDGDFLGGWEVVNEAMVGRGQIMRPVHIIASLDDRYLTTYVADGLIAATPTGSTAYALAAGGPILPPGLRNILIVPVAPHLSLDRAIVLAEGTTVRIKVRTDHEALLSVDGQTPVELLDNDEVTVRASEHTLEFIRLQSPDYFYRNLTSRMNQNPAASKPS
jgi:NAD+ kinase